MAALIIHQSSVSAICSCSDSFDCILLLSGNLFCPSLWEILPHHLVRFFVRFLLISYVSGSVGSVFSSLRLETVSDFSDFIGVDSLIGSDQFGGLDLRAFGGRLGGDRRGGDIIGSASIVVVDIIRVVMLNSKHVLHAEGEGESFVLELDRGSAGDEGGEGDRCVCCESHGS